MVVVMTEGMLREEIAEAVGFEYDAERMNTAASCRRSASFFLRDLESLAVHLGVADTLSEAPSRNEVIAAVSGAADFPLDDDHVSRRPTGDLHRLKKRGVRALHEEVVTDD